MGMPNRFEVVYELCLAHPEAFPQGAQNDPSRLAFLKAFVIPTLNAIDNGQWGVMVKSDQNDRVPVDIIMWRPTREFVDCLTGTGATWQEFPPAPDAWIWTAVGDTPIPPQPTTVYDEGEVDTFINDVVNSYNAAHESIDAASGIWLARMTWDARDLGWTASRAKHLAELRAALGLP